MNKKLYLIACEEGYIFDNGTCIQNITCDDKCKTCKDGPIEGNQNCLSCKDGNDVLQEGNCIKNCTDGFYEDSNKTCINCHENCKTCEKGEKDGNQNCLSCKDNVPYLINADGYNKNCIDNCLEFNLTLENNKCVNKSDNQPDYMIWIFIILITIILIVLALIICKRFYRKNDQDLMDNITTELNDKIVD